MILMSTLKGCQRGSLLGLVSNEPNRSSSVCQVLPFKATQNVNREGTPLCQLVFVLISGNAFIRRCLYNSRRGCRIYSAPILRHPCTTSLMAKDALKSRYFLDIGINELDCSSDITE